MSLSLSPVPSDGGRALLLVLGAASRRVSDLQPAAESQPAAVDAHGVQRRPPAGPAAVSFTCPTCLHGDTHLSVPPVSLCLLLNPSSSWPSNPGFQFPECLMANCQYTQLQVDSPVLSSHLSSPVLSSVHSPVLCPPGVRASDRSVVSGEHRLLSLHVGSVLPGQRGGPEGE